MSKGGSTKKAKRAHDVIPTATLDEWEVSAILDERGSGASLEYLVRWAGLQGIAARGAFSGGGGVGMERTALSHACARPGTDPQGAPWPDSWEPHAHVTAPLLLRQWEATKKDLRVRVPVPVPAERVRFADGTDAEVCSIVASREREDGSTEYLVEFAGLMVGGERSWLPAAVCQEGAPTALAVFLAGSAPKLVEIIGAIAGGDELVLVRNRSLPTASAHSFVAGVPLRAGRREACVLQDRNCGGELRSVGCAAWRAQPRVAGQVSA